MGNVRAVNQDAAGVHIVEAADQVDNGGLASACGAYDGVSVTGIGCEAHFIENLHTILIAKADLLECDFAVDGRHCHSVRSIFYINRLIDRLKNALQVSDRREQRIVKGGKGVDRFPES